MVQTKAIGAHFSALIENRNNDLSAFIGFESARSALYNFLITYQPRSIYIPYYVCEAIIEAIEKANIDVKFYHINKNFIADQNLILKDNELILLVNYFGLSNVSILKQLDRFGKNNIIVDCSQAFFQKPYDCLATFYSVRKFLPVPDGGLIKTDVKLSTSKADDSKSIKKYSYLLRRIISEPEESRMEYLQAENDFHRINKNSLSYFTRRLIETMDLEFIKNRRINNYRYYEMNLGDNNFAFELEEQAPLCFPYLVHNGHELKKKLINSRVFIPTYWPNIKATNSFESDLIKNTLFLPIDHRYNIDELDVVLNILKRG